MLRTFEIKKIVKTEEEVGPFILTINDNNQLIGDLARSLQNYMRLGKDISVNGHYIGKDFIIETINHTGNKIGSQLDFYA
jgi:hypothetical protein